MLPKKPRGILYLYYVHIGVSECIDPLHARHLRRLCHAYHFGAHIGLPVNAASPEMRPSLNNAQCNCPPIWCIQDYSDDDVRWIGSIGVLSNERNIVLNHDWFDMFFSGKKHSRRGLVTPKAGTNGMDGSNSGHYGSHEHSHRHGNQGILKRWSLVH